MTLIDSHCHLESFFHAKTLSDVLTRAHNADVGGIICIGTDTDDWRLYRDLTRDNPGFLHYTAGLHPCNVDENWQDAMSVLSPWFMDSTAPIGLGEIGLDNFHLPKDTDAAREARQHQRDAFQMQLELACQLDCPVVIHSRNAFAECVQMIDATGVDWRKVVFHCFSEGADEILELNKRGGRGSFTGILTYPSAGNIRAAALAQGLPMLMLETDSPYLAPQPVRGKPNEPAHVRHTAEAAAKLFGIDLAALSEIATANTRAFFGLGD